MSQRILTILFLVCLSGCGDDSINPLDTRYVSPEVAYTRQGWIAYNGKDLSQATQSFESAITQNPDFAEAHTGLGWIALEQRDFAAANEHFASGLGSEPESLPALVGVASVALALGEYERSAQAAESALSLMGETTPPSPVEITSDTVQLLLVQGYYALGEYEKSLAHLQTVAPQELSPDSPSFEADLIRAIEQTQVEE